MEVCVLTDPTVPFLTIIIPTYNEAKTIFKTIEKISGFMRTTKIPFEILVVDDSSPDGTSEEVWRAIEAEYPVGLIVRSNNPGLSQAVIEGFRNARGDIFVVTDADLSHDVTAIPGLYGAVTIGADIAIGSRYMPGGNIIDWPIKRRVVSWGATILSQLIYPELTDPVSGFFAVKKSLVSRASLNACGYKILLEVLSKTDYKSVVEIPYTFTNRRDGESKLRTGTMIEFLKQIYNQ